VVAALKRAREENYPVAPLFLPRRARHHLLALYEFARLVDDVGDEGPARPDDRLRQLDWLEAELDQAVAGQATHPVLARLAPTIRTFDLPLELFRRLIEANRRDQVLRRYGTYDELIGYCELSANPIGRLVLLVVEADTPSRQLLSDDVCTALQLVEHWQDIGEDAARGRIYLPAADLQRYAVAEADLTAASASADLRRLVAFEAARTRDLLASGYALAAELAGRTKLAIAGFVAGGEAALDAIEAAGFDVLAHRCRPRRHRFALRLLRALSPGATTRSLTGGPRWI